MTQRSGSIAVLAMFGLVSLIPVATPAALPEVQNVSMSGDGLFWDAVPGAVQYRVYRGLVSGLPDYCAEGVGNASDRFIFDSETPPPGDAYTYLITALDSAEEGPVGLRTDGTDRFLTIDCDLDNDDVRDSVDNCPRDGNTGQADQDSDGLGDACDFPAQNVSLLGRVVMRELPDTQRLGNDIWSYVSPGGEEYAILGTTKGTAFVKISDPANPGLAGWVDGEGIDETWRDMATFGSHAYIVTDGSGVGLQIADLSDIDNDNVVRVNTTDLGQGFADAHNVYVNPDSGYLYLCIPNLNGGNGLTVVDLNADPADPTIAGFWTDVDPGVRCHDVQVVSYTSGPNAGKEIAFCFAESDGIYIADVTDKANMFRISKVTYPGLTYSHQGWLEDARRYLFANDELDERDDPGVTSTTTYVIDVNNLNNPSFHSSFTNGLASIDHNLMVRGDFVYEANYSSGLRVWDVSNINNPQESGFFDTRPENDNTNFEGAWGVSSQLPSGLVVVSDRQRGLFVLDPTAALDAPAPECGEGGALDAGLNDCVAAVCARDAWCCAERWDALCVEAAGTVCGLRCD